MIAENGSMDARRKRFALALAVFAAWVAALGYMAATSAEKPTNRAEAADTP